MTKETRSNCFGRYFCKINDWNDKCAKRLAEIQLSRFSGGSNINAGCSTLSDAELLAVCPLLLALHCRIGYAETKILNNMRATSAGSNFAGGKGCLWWRLLGKLRATCPLPKQKVLLDMTHQKRRATEQECAVFTSLLGEIVAARSKELHEDFFCSRRYGSENLCVLVRTNKDE